MPRWGNTVTGPSNHVRTEAIYAFVHDRAEPIMICPTAREVADHFGISVSTAHWHISKLQRQGRLVADSNKLLRLP